MATTQFDPQPVIDAANAAIAEIVRGRENFFERQVPDYQKPRWFGLVPGRTREEAVAYLKSHDEYHIMRMWGARDESELCGIRRVAQAALASGQKVTLDAADIAVLRLTP